MTSPQPSDERPRPETPSPIDFSRAQGDFGILSTPHWELWDAPASSVKPSNLDREVQLPAPHGVESADSMLLERHAEFVDLDTWPEPTNPKFFRLLGGVLLTGRDRRKRYSQMWQVPICTSSWIGDRARKQGWTWLRSPLVLDEWNPRNLSESLDQIVRSQTDQSWQAFLARMSIYMMPPDEQPSS